MNYKKFKEILDTGETSNVDFKILSNAFNGADMDERSRNNGELIKDILAMANNGNIASYLIIGVSDDRTDFRSVDNDKLTNDNIIRLCREYIFPIPLVQVYCHTWNVPDDQKVSGKKFVIIQIGPQAQNCFRFKNDIIVWNKKGCCYRKEEVWIRCGTTSALATPEEIGRMLLGKRPLSRPKLKSNIKYPRLPVDEIENTIKNDLIEIMLSDFGAKVFTDKLNQYYPKEQLQVKILVKDLPLTLDIHIVDKATRLFSAMLPFRTTHVSHGFLLISLGEILAQAVKSSPHKIKESWGWTYTVSPYWAGFNGYPTHLPDSVQHLRFGIAIKNISSTESLKSTLHDLMYDITQKDDIYSLISSNYSQINTHLNNWRTNRCQSPNPYERGTRVKLINKTNQVLSNTCFFINTKKY